jgi:hypothetical protein
MVSLHGWVRLGQPATKRPATERDPIDRPCIASRSWPDTDVRRHYAARTRSLTRKIDPSRALPVHAGATTERIWTG